MFLEGADKTFSGKDNVAAANAFSFTGKQQPAVAAVQRVKEEEEFLQPKPALQKQSPEDEEKVQGKFFPVQKKSIVHPSSLTAFVPVQKKENDTGLPDNLKSGVEALSGFSMDDVKVHYNSAKPAQLNALAYAQGTDIHVASGQEKHLPHEAWHVVQQKQGRVQATTQMKAGTPVNDDPGLEKEADVMGHTALNSTVQTKPFVRQPQPVNGLPVQPMWVKGSEFANDGRRDSNISVASLKDFEIEELLEVMEEAKVGINAKFTGNVLRHTDGREWVFNLQYPGEQPADYYAVLAKIKEREKDLDRKPGTFSGESRAADDSRLGEKRENVGAAYQDPLYDVVRPSKVGTVHRNVDPASAADPQSQFTISAQAGKVLVKIIHYGPWNKGERSPGQSTVMGNVSAKNYIKYIMHGHDTPKVSGRFEWLHLVGSGLGGLNVVGNLVAGTFDANTQEIPQESRMALWSKKDFKGGSMIFEAVADLEGDSWIATGNLKLSGKDSNGKIITRDYDPMRELVLTSSEYKKIKEEIEKGSNARGDGKVMISADLVQLAARAGVVLIVGIIVYKIWLLKLFSF